LLATEQLSAAPSVTTAERIRRDLSNQLRRTFVALARLPCVAMTTAGVRSVIGRPLRSCVGDVLQTQQQQQQHQQDDCVWAASAAAHTQHITL